MRPIAAILFVLSCDALAADPYDAVNRLRAGDGACMVAQKPAPLMRQAALERAAAGLARGQSLRDSLKESGYRATASRFISITGAGAGGIAFGHRAPALAARRGLLHAAWRNRRGFAGTGSAIREA